MRITQDYLSRFNYRNFYDSFRELYGEIFSNSDIDNLLETNEFCITCYVPDLLIYQEVDSPSQEIAEYFISIIFNNTLYPRFRIRWTRVPLTTGETVDRIGAIEVLNNLDIKALFCETYEFLIPTAYGNQIDSIFLEHIIHACNIDEYTAVYRQHLKKIIAENDPRIEFAKYILDRYPDNN